VVRIGLRGWENYKIDGKDIKFTSDENGLSVSLLDQIPFDVIIELSTAILKINKLSDAEIKN